MRTAVVLFNRDLRVHDHPALAEAHRIADRVVPLFVLDPAILTRRSTSTNRVAFLLECLTDLRDSLRQRGGDLIVRHGDPVRETMRIAGEVGAETVFVGSDVSRVAGRRQQRLTDACDAARVGISLQPGTTIVAPGALAPAGGDHYRVFTAYWRSWRATPWRALRPAPGSIRLPDGVDPGAIPGRLPFGPVRGRHPSPDRPAGGERVARRRLDRWVRTRLDRYPAGHDDLPGDLTSHLSPYLHFGCLSALEVARRTSTRPGGEDLVRQLCWRDFHHQVTAAFPAIATEDYRPRGDRWRDDPSAARAWAEGRTGYPIIDAGMRQLKAEAFMHNRARLLVASFLTKHLYIDWRVGAAHFLEWLVDGDVANNSGNWQWIAGTGNDTRPNRVFNPLRQAARFDPAGDYVRRYVPELAGVAGPVVHEPWRLGAAERRRLDYPAPIVEPGAPAGILAHRRGR